MNANLITTAILTIIAAVSSVSNHARSAVKARLVLELLTIVLNVNVQKDTSDQLSVSVDQNATEMLTAQDQDQLASTVFVRTHVTVLAESMPIATFVD